MKPHDYITLLFFLNAVGWFLCVAFFILKQSYAQSLQNITEKYNNKADAYNTLDADWAKSQDTIVINNKKIKALESEVKELHEKLKKIKTLVKDEVVDFDFNFFEYKPPTREEIQRYAADK